MKPRINKRPVYSVIFMRDDCKVKRFRLHAFWIRAAVVFLLLLLAAGSLCGWGLYYYWQKHDRIKAELAVREELLRENQRQLERLANLEKILESNDPARLHTSLSGVENPEAVSGPAGESTQAGEAGYPSRTGAQTGAQIGDEAQGATADSENPADLPPEEHQVRLANINLSLVEPSGIRLAFDLTNQDSDQPLSGQITLALVGKDGAVTELPDAGRRELGITQVSRFKPIDLTLNIPENLALKDLAFVRVSVDTEGNELFRQDLPLN